MGERDIELGRLHADATAVYGPQHYFQEVSELGVLLENTGNMVQKLKAANLECSSVSGHDAIKEIKVKIQEEIDEVGQMAHNMKEKLNKIFQSALTPILNNLSKGRGYPVTLPKTMDPSAMSMTMELKIKLKEKENDFKLQNLRKTVWEEYVEVVQRRTFTVTGIKLSDEVVHMITASNIVQMFENALQGINPEQVVPAMMDEIKERQAAAMDLDKKILELQQNFAEMGALLESREKMDKALNKVRKLTVRGQSTQKELRKEMAENDRLLEENGRLFTLVISLGISLCMIAIILLLQV
ncbi:syntaxin-132-like isoform X2 [Lolium perenne]|uniref:syntaxin-132-like isoform X2 n=1 Tax=Lolium perenne TaxID=4522 RepID=UPI0021F5C7E8|nr:putative syntaxin-131 isoform X1 [Lolium perenne]